MPGDSTPRPAPYPAYCDVSLPVPVDQLFTYALPAALRDRVEPGCRVLVPFGNRKLNGVVLRTHNDPPGDGTKHAAIKEILKLLDSAPVLDANLLKLGHWIADYYCAPLGETLRSMTPLGGEMRRGTIYSLTSTGRDIARQLHLGAASDEAIDDEKTQILRMLDARPLAGSYLKSKFPKSAALLKALEKSELIVAEDVAAERDPLRASAERLRAEFLARPDSVSRDPGRKPGDETGVKLPKPQRELLSYLELHPGSHNVATLEEFVAKASVSARALARQSLVRLTIEPAHSASGRIRAPHSLNAHQQAAFDQISDALSAQRFQTFLLEGVTGSGKTEVYLRAIEASLAMGRGALLLVPEIGLTPAVAGQFHQRFPKRVAMLHSAFQDPERAQEWRRIHSGEASVVVATRSGVFSPVRNLGLILVDEEHDGSYKQQETPRYHGRDVAVMRARELGAVVVLGSATPSLETRYNAATGKYVRLALPERIEQRPMPKVTLIDMRQEFLETRKQDTFSRALVEAVQERLENREQTMLLLNRRGFSSFVTCRACGERVQCINCSVTLTYHRRDRRMLCHYCNYSEPIPETLPEVRQRLYPVPGLWIGTFRRRAARGFSHGAHRAAGSRLRAHETRLRKYSFGVSRTRLRHSGGHADDRQRPRYSERHAGGHHQRRYRFGAAGFSCR